MPGRWRRVSYEDASLGLESGVMNVLLGPTLAGIHQLFRRDLRLFEVLWRPAQVEHQAMVDLDGWRALVVQVGERVRGLLVPSQEDRQFRSGLVDLQPQFDAAGGRIVMTL